MIAESKKKRKEGKKDGASGDVRSLQGGVLSRERERERKKKSQTGVCVSHIWNSSCRRKRQRSRQLSPALHSIPGKKKRTVPLCPVFFVSWTKMPFAVTSEFYC